MEVWNVAGKGSDAKPVFCVPGCASMEQGSGSGGVRGRAATGLAACWGFGYLSPSGSAGSAPRSACNGGKQSLSKCVCGEEATRLGSAAIQKAELSFQHLSLQNNLKPTLGKKKSNFYSLSSTTRAKNRHMGDSVGVIKAVEVFSVVWYTLTTINQYLNNKCTVMHAEVITGLSSPAVWYRCCSWSLGVGGGC